MLSLSPVLWFRNPYLVPVTGPYFEGFYNSKASARTDACPFREQDMAQNVLSTVTTMIVAVVCARLCVLLSMWVVVSAERG